MPNQPPASASRVYRLALYGRSGAGKTCIIAALASPRIANQLGYDCADLVRVDEVFGKEAKLDDKDDRKQAALMGKEALNKAKKSIANGEVPEPTPPNREPFIYEYEFTGPDRPAFRVELVDYSGELIDTELDPEGLALELQKKLATMDGLLVLAESPIPPKMDPTFHEEINKLLTAFIRLKKEREKKAAFEMPLVLLMNKWDRVSKNIDYGDPEKEQKKLELLFSKNPGLPHWRMFNALKSLVSDGDFRKFPVSALGPCEVIVTEGGGRVESPKKFNPLRSFGLEDPFVWIVKRRDEIDLRNYELSTSSYTRWTRNLLLSLFRLPWHGENLCSRFHENTDEWFRAMTAQRKSRLWWPFLTGFLLIVLGLSAEATYDRVTLWKLNAVVRSQAASDTDLKYTQQWFEEYVASYRHWISRIFLPKEEAVKKAVGLSDRREKRAWADVTAASSFEGANGAITRYLDQFPYGPHVNEAFQKRKEIQDIVATGQLGKKITSLMDRGAFLEASRALINADIDSNKLKELKVSFGDQVRTLARTRLDDKRSHYDWKSAYQLLDELSQIDPSLMPQGSTMELKKWRDEVETIHDKHLYQQVLEYKDETRCQEYFVNAPKQIMKQAVEKYIAYLQKNREKLPLTVVLSRLDWINSWNESDNLVTVTLNGSKIIERPNVESRNGQSSGEIGRQTVEARLTDEAVVNARVFEKNVFWWDRALEGRAAKSYASLNGSEIELKCAQGCTDQRCKAVFRIEGVPPEPTLPLWSE